MSQRRRWTPDEIKLLRNYAPEDFAREGFEFKVRCCNKLHRILFTPNGRLRLLDHQNEEQDQVHQVYAALQGRSRPRCYDMLAALRSGSGGGNAAMRQIVRYTHGIRVVRSGRQVRFNDKLTDTLEHRLMVRITAIATKEAETVAVVIPGYKNRLEWTVISAGGEESVWGGRISELVLTRKGSRPKEPTISAYINCSIRLRWYSQVYRKGLAVVDDRFILKADIKKRTPDIAKVVYVGFHKQTPNSHHHWLRPWNYQQNGEQWETRETFQIVRTDGIVKRTNGEWHFEE